MNIRKDFIAKRNQNRSMVIAQNGMVCTSVPLASMAGIDILKAGGNAVDAAVAANAMLSLVEPMMCGPGGDLFAILWIEKEKKLYGLNASGRSPYGWDLKVAEDLGLQGIPENHPLAWTVPGCVSGWQALSRRFGARPWSELFHSVREYAEKGFPVSPIVARYWPFDPKEFPTLARTFMLEGKPPEIGQIFRNPDLAAFYGMLSKEGPDIFYKGEIAERIVRFSEKVGGRLAIRDFEDHTCNWVDLVNTSYKGYHVWEIPPNGQGIATLQILNILEHFDIDSLSPESPEYLHLLIEAKKLAYEDRAVYYADPDFADVPVEMLISKDYAKQRTGLIDPNHASTQIRAGILEKHSDTTYLTAADSEGNMISLIQSLFLAFGSKIVPDGLGFALQNRGLSFALDPNHRNRLEEHKRPFHTIIPAFVTRDGDPIFSFGVMGGDFQPQGQVQVLLNIIEFGMSVQQAGDWPRIAHSGSSVPEGDIMKDSGQVFLEPGIPVSTKQALRAKGHSIAEQGGTHGGYQGIWREGNPLRYYGGSEPRMDGCALGY